MMAITCPVCNAKIGSLNDSWQLTVGSDKIRVHHDCWEVFSKHPENYGVLLTQAQSEEKDLINQQNAERLEGTKRLETVKLTTAFSFANYEIEDEIGIVTAECVFGMNVVRDIFASIRDFFGGRSQGSQRLLRDARNTCLYELKREAVMLGADGVMGIDLDYSEMSGKGKSMLFLVFSGTAVKFKENSNSNSMLTK